MAAALALVICAASILVCGSSSTAYASAENGNAMGHIPMDKPIKVPESFYIEPGPNKAGEIPASYDLRTLGRVTPVRNQNPFGTCWAFAAIASVESNLLTNGYADETLNLSELHLAYYSYHNVPDKLGNTAGDYVYPLGTTYMDRGGNMWIATNTLANWEGLVDETLMPYPNTILFDTNATYPDAYAYSRNKYNIDHVSWLSTAFASTSDPLYASQMNMIKQMVMEKGAAVLSLYYDDAYHNESTGAYYCNVNSLNHDVTLIGWDDNYSRDNFKSSLKPSSNGAWLIKNSWGPSWGEHDGYFWLSYEDRSFLRENNSVAFFEASPVDDDHNIYQYDGGIGLTYLQARSGTKIASVYTVADDNESLSEVCFFTEQSNVNYKIKVYTGVNQTPESGTSALATPLTGTIAIDGYHSITLPDPVELVKGEKFSIVLELSTTNNAEVYLDFDMAHDTEFWTLSSSAKRGQTFYKSPSDSYWTDMHEQFPNASLRLKGITTRPAPARFPGDVDNSGSIDSIDSILLRRYLAKWDGVIINESNANVNGDDKIDSVDSLLLRRYLAKWDGVLLL